jgi:ABC-type phosphate transport system permease subunit
MLPMIQQPAWTILSGMNAHGRIGIANLIAAIASLALAVIALGTLQWGLIGAALAIVLPLNIIYGIYIPRYTCRRLDLSIREYATKSLYRPAIMALPFALCLIAARMIFRNDSNLALLAGAISGGVVLGLLYWRYVIPERIKNQAFRLKSKIVERVTITEP